MPPDDQLSQWEDRAAARQHRQGLDPQQRAQDELGRLRNYRACFESGPGREVLQDLMQHYEDRSSHVPGDPYTTAYHEGQRSVVLAIRAAMAAARHGPQEA